MERAADHLRIFNVSGGALFLEQIVLGVEYLSVYIPLLRLQLSIKAPLDKIIYQNDFLHQGEGGHSRSIFH